VKGQTLKENKDFRRLYYRGKSDAGSCLATYIMKRCSGSTRIGITTSKKIGNAVNRNRARRVIRAAFRELQGSLNGSYDIVFVARTRTTVVKMQEVKAQMEQQLKRLGAINETVD
jgi:ribonuclease P protein component